jgi:hypothetical protein
MTGTATLTIAQHEAINRLVSSIRDSADIQRVVIHPCSVLDPSASGYVRVVFDAGYGTATYDIDDEGNSEQVVFGHSEIAA